MKNGAPILAALLIAWAATANAQTTDSTNVGGTAPSGSTSTTAPPQPAYAAPPAPASTPPDYPRGRFSGMLYVDAYYNVTGDPTHTYTSTGSDLTPVSITGVYSADSLPRVIGKDLNGILLRRAYLTYDNDLSARYAVRFRLEADSRSLTSDAKIGVNVKAAYVQVKNVYTRASLFAGMISTPTWENYEEAWGYRSVERTLADFRGLASSVDLGVQVKGAIDPAKRIGYYAMIGTGSGQRPEDNRYKRMYLSLPLRPVENLWFEPYVDYEWAAANRDQATYKLSAAYDLKRATVGGEIVDRISHRGADPNREPFGYSVFGRWMPREQIGAFLRFDRWQPDTRDADRIDSDLWIAGLDWQPYKDVHILPNVLATQYHARGAMEAPPHHDMQARVTLYWKFSRP